MDNKRIALVVMMGLFMISFASAVAINAGTSDVLCSAHTQKETLTFSFSDTIANSCTVSTIDHPNGTIEIYQVMTKTSSTFNSTILGGNFTELGTYKINIECDQGYGNVCRNITEYGISVNLFIFYTIFYVFLLIISYWLVYKFATFNGGKLKDNYFYYWAGFLDLILFVVIEINGFGGADTPIVSIIKMLAFGSGGYFLVQGIFPSLSWKKSEYQ